MRIVFFGSSKFACPSIKLLHKMHNLVCVVCSHNPCEAKNLANQLGIKILDPPTPNTSEFIDMLKNISPDMICLAAYGYILSKEILHIPKIAAINLHPSLLPSYRGASPIRWALLNGEKYTGVTTFIMDEHIDTGKILLQRKVEIYENEIHGELEYRLGEIGAELLLETINKFNEIIPKEQPKVGISYAPKIKKEMRKIDWNKPSQQIVNLIRALSPIPGAYTFFRGKELEILIAKSIDIKGIPGRIELVTKKRVIVGAGDGCVEIILVKPEAKKEQSISDFINGYKPQIGEFFESGAL